MKKLFFMMFVLGIMATGFTSCGGGDDEGGDEENTESAEGGDEAAE